MLSDIFMLYIAHRVRGGKAGTWQTDEFVIYFHAGRLITEEIDYVNNQLNWWDNYLDDGKYQQRD